MADETLDMIRQGLNETRENLAHWVEATPEAKKRVQCCDDETCVDERFHLLARELTKIDEGTYGICEVCHEAVEPELLRMDYTSAVCLGHFSDEELRQLEAELELSQIVQRGLLPQRAPEIPGLAVAAFSRPAQIVSGDYFDFVKFKDGGHGIVMADVSGHGVSAGMLMSSLQTAIHTLVPAADSPLDVLERINHLYAHNIRVTSFVTIFFGKLDPVTRTFTYGSAGHNSAYLYRPQTGEEILLHPTGPAIGLMEGFHVRSEQVALKPGDLLVLYTDGVTEAMNGKHEQFGLDRLSDTVRANSSLSPEQVIQKILVDLSEFTDAGTLVDDVTLVAAKAS